MIICEKIERSTLNFEWDSEKEEINIRKHGIDFDTASHVFNDKNRLEFYD